MNIIDIIILSIISLLVIISVKYLYKNKGSCNGTCTSCSSTNKCSSIKNFYEDYKKDYGSTN